MAVWKAALLVESLAGKLAADLVVQRAARWAVSTVVRWGDL